MSVPPFLVLSWIVVASEKKVVASVTRRVGCGRVSVLKWTVDVVIVVHIVAHVIVIVGAVI
jgi:hypothetical protein